MLLNNVVEFEKYLYISHLILYTFLKLFQKNLNKFIYKKYLYRLSIFEKKIKSRDFPYNSRILVAFLKKM